MSTGFGRTRARAGTFTTRIRRDAPPQCGPAIVNLPVLIPGILIAAAGFGCLAFPDRFVTLAENLLARREAQWISGGVRLGLGGLVLAGSGATAHPAAVATFGALLAAAGAVLVLLPRPRFEALARWGIELSPGAIRLASLAATVLGCWLAYAATGSPG